MLYRTVEHSKGRMTGKQHLDRVDQAQRIGRGIKKTGKDPAEGFDICFLHAVGRRLACSSFGMMVDPVPSSY